MEKKPLYLLSYDHGGYILWGDHFAERLSSAAEWMRKYPKFKFGLDNEAYCYDAYAEQNPAILDKMKKMLKLYPDRFGIGSATYGQPLSVFIDNESNIRQLTYAIQAEQKYFDLRPPVYAMSEHAMHAQIPQLAKGCGYEMALMRTHFQMYGYNPTYPVSFGSWVGLDGTRMPSVPTYEQEGAHFGRTTIDNWILTRWPREAKETPEDFEAMFENIHPLLASRYDDVILRCEEMTAFAERKENYHWVILEDLPKLYAGLENQMDFVTKPQDFPVRMPWGYCGNLIFRQTVRAQDLVNRAERVAAAAKLLDEDTDCGDLEKAWKNLLVAQHHDVQICGLKQEAEKFLTASIAASQTVIDRSMKVIANSMGGADRQNLLVFNPSEKRRKQWVECTVRMLTGSSDLTKLTAVCGDTFIPCSVMPLDLDPDGDRPQTVRVSLLCELDGLSAKVFRFVVGSAEKISYTYQKGVLTVGDLVIRLDKTGIASVTAKNRKMLENGRLIGVIGKKEYQSSGSWVVYPQAGGVVAKQVGTIGPLPCSIELFTDGEKLNFRIVTEHHGEQVGIPKEYDSFWNNRNGFVHEDKLRFLFTPGIDAKNAYGVYTHPFAVDRTDAMYIEGNDFAALSDGKDALLLLQDGGKCLTREEEKLSIPLAFAHKYAWGMKGLHGAVENAFALQLTDASIASMLDASDAYHLPFETLMFAQTPVGVTCTETQFVSVKASENLRLSAFAPSKNGVMLRFWETEGKDASLAIEGKQPLTLHPVDFLGNPTADHPITAHQIITYEINSEESNE